MKLNNARQAVGQVLPRVCLIDVLQPNRARLHSSIAPRLPANPALPKQFRESGEASTTGRSGPDAESKPNSSDGNGTSGVQQERAPQESQWEGGQTFYSTKTGDTVGPAVAAAADERRRYLREVEAARVSLSRPPPALLERARPSEAADPEQPDLGTFWGLLVLGLAYVHHSTTGRVCLRTNEWIVLLIGLDD